MVFFVDFRCCCVETINEKTAPLAHSKKCIYSPSTEKQRKNSQFLSYSKLSLARYERANDSGKMAITVKICRCRCVKAIKCILIKI